MVIWLTLSSIYRLTFIHLRWPKQIWFWVENSYLVAVSKSFYKTVKHLSFRDAGMIFQYLRIFILMKSYQQHKLWHLTFHVIPENKFGEKKEVYKTLCFIFFGKFPNIS